MIIRKLTFNNKSSYALRLQQKLGQYDFPFTLNIVNGCGMGCKYCFSPNVLYTYEEKKKELFFTNIIVKEDKAILLDKELSKYSALPQHMKRVQVNEVSEYYQPEILRDIKTGSHPDIMKDVLEVFKKHWNLDNRWMVHLLTKSHLITTHLGILKEMKEMIQVEFSFASVDEDISRSLEFYTPSIKKRLATIEELSKAGIFVRVMAMPFCGDEADLKKLKELTFDRGAQAFKNKGLNYFKSWDQLRENISFDDFLVKKYDTGKGRVDEKDSSLIIKSGEYALDSGGKIKQTNVSFPMVDKDFKAENDWSKMTKMKDRFMDQQQNKIDCGYKSCNPIDWGYIE